MFDGVIIDDEIVGVGERWAIECPLQASGKRGGRGGQ